MKNTFKKGDIVECISPGTDAWSGGFQVGDKTCVLSVVGRRLFLEKANGHDGNGWVKNKTGKLGWFCFPENFRKVKGGR